MRIDVARLLFGGTHTDRYSLFRGDCLEVLRALPDSCVDLVLTSPPYDDLRNYRGQSKWSFEIFTRIAGEIKRVLKQGGVCVWIVNDATRSGSETCTSFRQALHFKEIGLRLHDTMIFRKLNPLPLTHNRYEQEFEYMFVFAKEQPSTFNPLRETCKHAGKSRSGGTFYQTAQAETPSVANTPGPVREGKNRSNIWAYPVGGAGASRKFKHPAKFPLQLALDHILSWSNPGDFVLDPFLGSGTSGEAALTLKRRFIGVEIAREYYRTARDRLKTL